MSRKPFYLSLRSGVWYAKIVDPKTGNQLSAVSTGQTDRDAAVLTVSRWLVEGIPQKRINSKKDVSEALTVNRLFNVLGDIELTNRDAEKIMNILKQRGLLKKCVLSSKNPWSGVKTFSWTLEGEENVFIRKEEKSR